MYRQLFFFKHVFKINMKKLQLFVLCVRGAFDDFQGRVHGGGSPPRSNFGVGGYYPPVILN